jgi:hypothetical protein
MLNMHAYLGELERVSSFKEKARTQPNNINAGLLTYPVLMAADIIIHKAVKVPVGKDQEQHLEMARTFGNRFNRMYNMELFPEPQAFNYGSELVKIPGLQGGGKMSKSDGDNNVINLVDSPDAIRKKMSKAVTDTGPTEPNTPPTQPVQNIFDLMKVVSTEDTLKHFTDAYANCNIRYGDLKKQLAEDMITLSGTSYNDINEYRVLSSTSNTVTIDYAEPNPTVTQPATLIAKQNYSDTTAGYTRVSVFITSANQNPRSTIISVSNEAAPGQTGYYYSNTSIFPALNTAFKALFPDIQFSYENGYCNIANTSATQTYTMNISPEPNGIFPAYFPTLGAMLGFYNYVYEIQPASFIAVTEYVPAVNPVNTPVVLV